MNVLTAAESKLISFAYLNLIENELIQRILDDHSGRQALLRDFQLTFNAPDAEYHDSLAVPYLETDTNICLIWMHPENSRVLLLVRGTKISVKTDNQIYL